MNRPEDDEPLHPAMVEKFRRVAMGERETVKELGEQIGYGRMIQLAEELWTEMLGSINPATYYRESLLRENNELAEQVRRLNEE